MALSSFMLSPSNHSVLAESSLVPTGPYASLQAVCSSRLARRTWGKSISYYGQALRAFRHLNLIIPVAAEDWFSRLKQNGASSGIGAFHSFDSM